MRRDWHLPGELASVTAARVGVRDQLSAWGCAPEVVEDAALVVTELVANAVRHATGDVAVSAVVGRHGVQLGVTDHDGGPIRPRAVVPVAAENGRGLAIVAALSRRWGVERLAEGKRVWCLLGEDEQPAPPDARTALRSLRGASAALRRVGATARGRFARAAQRAVRRSHGWSGGLGAGA